MSTNELEILERILKGMEALAENTPKPKRISQWHIVLAVIVGLVFGGSIFAGCAVYVDSRIERDRLEREAMFAMLTNLVSKLREDPKHFERTEKQFEAVIEYYREKLNGTKPTK